jgi:NAD(P)-dependent dehydrogenase (short-subunit alcohol dehydrogenase family)
MRDVDGINAGLTQALCEAYAAAQAGRHSLTKNLAIELAPYGIRVNAAAR